MDKRIFFFAFSKRHVSIADRVADSITNWSSPSRKDEGDEEKPLSPKPGRRRGIRTVQYGVKGIFSTLWNKHPPSSQSSGRRRAEAGCCTLSFRFGPGCS